MTYACKWSTSTSCGYISRTVTYTKRDYSEISSWGLLEYQLYRKPINSLNPVEQTRGGGIVSGHFLMPTKTTPFLLSPFHFSFRSPGTPISLAAHKIIFRSPKQKEKRQEIFISCSFSGSVLESSEWASTHYFHEKNETRVLSLLGKSLWPSVISYTNTNSRLMPIQVADISLLWWLLSYTSFFIFLLVLYSFSAFLQLTFFWHDL